MQPFFTPTIPVRTSRRSLRSSECYLCSQPLSLSHRRVTFFRRVSPSRLVPTAHAQSNHGSCHSDAFSRPQQRRPFAQPYDPNKAFSLLVSLRNIYYRIEQSRENLPLALISATCLILAWIFNLFHVLPFLIRPLQALCFLIVGVPATLASIARLLQSGVNVDVLMTLAAIASIFTGSVFEGCLLMTLYALSHAGERFVVGRARGDLDTLSDLVPSTALLIYGNEETPSSMEDWQGRRPIVIPLADLQVGDIVLVKGGEVAPSDGIVVKGTAYITTEHITGEATPRSVNVGDEIPAGARSVDDAIFLRVTAVGSESSIARIARLVTVAQEHRPRVSRFFDRFGQAYGRLILFTSFLIATLLPAIAMLLGKQPVKFYGNTGSLKRSLGFLVAASPCALVIGAPVAYLSALSACARRGVLVKGGAKALEAVATIKKVAFDKTGTLTTGNLRLNSVLLLEFGLQRLQMATDEKIEYALSIATTLGDGSVHPVAKAIQMESVKRHIHPLVVKNLKTVAGSGVQGTVKINGAFMPAFLGRAEFVLDGQSKSQVEELKRSSYATTITLLKVKGEVYVFNFVDELRPEAPQTLRELSDERVSTAVLTGDGKVAAETMAESLGHVNNVYSELKPEDKLRYIEDWSSSENLLMCGDGVNDAPALAAATAGVACGLSSATAVNAADVVLVKSYLRDLPWLMRKAKSTERIVKQNIVLALVFMAFGLLPSLAGALPLWLVVTLHEGGTFVVGLNSLRLLSDKLS